MQDNGKWIYSGGQKISDEANEEPLNLENWKSKSTYAQGKVLYHGYKTCEDKEGEKLCYSHLSGDITNAYDPETVREVKRHMFSFMTGRDDHPMVFVVFDRITACDASFKKTFLLHMQTRPLIWKTPSGKPCAVISNLSSRLYVQSLITDMDYEMIGGPGNEYNVKGINYSEDLYKGQPLLYTYNSEGGWGRLEISPAAPAETDLLLTVMYPAADTDYSPKLVFGDYNTLPFHEAVEIKNDTLIGAAILNTAVIFPKNGTCFEDQVSFTLPENAAVKKCYVNCLKGGKWQLSDGRIVTVEAENGMAEFDVIDTLDTGISIVIPKKALVYGNHLDINNNSINLVNSSDLVDALDVLFSLVDFEEENIKIKYSVLFNEKELVLSSNIIQATVINLLNEMTSEEDSVIGIPYSYIVAAEQIKVLEDNIWFGDTDLITDDELYLFLCGLWYRAIFSVSHFQEVQRFFIPMPKQICLKSLIQQ